MKIRRIISRNTKESVNDISFITRVCRALLVGLLFVSGPYSTSASQIENDLLLFLPSLIAATNPQNSQTPQFSINNGVVKFKPTDSEADIKSSGAASVTIGDLVVYIGTQQKTSINQDPIIIAFDRSSSAQRWVATNHEATGADGRGVSLLWSGTKLYASYTVDGTQGQASKDFRRVSQGAAQTWLRSYGSGGGPKVSVVAELDPNTGSLKNAVYISAVLSNAKSNTLLVNDMRTNSLGNLIVNADSFFAPRAISGQALDRRNTGPSPFSYSLELAPDLSGAISALSSDY